MTELLGQLHYESEGSIATYGRINRLRGLYDWWVNE